MPKRTEIIKKITKAATANGMTFAFDRRGGNHDIYKLDGMPIPVGRHRDFDPSYAVMVYKECEPKLGKGWWK
jgi:hypothetical protein